MKRTAAISAVLMGVLVTAPAHATNVTVTVTGQVLFNGIGPPPLGDANPGDEVVMSFTVDSNDFVEGIPGDTRGYAINQSSFSLSFSGGASVGLQSPFPGGETPYFTLVDGFPVSDGFFVSSSPFSPGGVPLQQAPFQANLDLGYGGGALGSLDILAAQGVYGFDGLTRFSYNLWSIFPDNVAMEIDFAQITIQAVPVPAALWLLASALLGLIGMRRRR